jgi:hypothetical protein
MEWSETMRELRGEKQDVFARQRTRSNCRLYAARGGERHCQVIPETVESYQVNKNCALYIFDLFKNEMKI